MIAGKPEGEVYSNTLSSCLKHDSILLESSQHTACICSDGTDAPREEPFEEVPQEGNAESDSQHTQLLARLLLALLGVQRLDQSTSCKLQ